MGAAKKSPATQVLEWAVVELPGEGEEDHKSHWWSRHH
jgi:hypothetical protein